MKLKHLLSLVFLSFIMFSSSALANDFASAAKEAYTVYEITGVVEEIFTTELLLAHNGKKIIVDVQSSPKRFNYGIEVGDTVTFVGIVFRGVFRARLIIKDNRKILVRKR